MRFVIAVTGGGSQAISSLLGVGGASRSILAAAVPYAPAALVEWLGGRPDEFCSSWTARSMAMAAYLRAQAYDPGATTCGVSCTASLVSDRPKRGPHRAHLAYQTATSTSAISLELEKGRRTRGEEESLVSDLLLNCVAEACGASSRMKLALADSEHVHSARVLAPTEQQELLRGQRHLLPLLGAIGSPPPRAIFPGAFHPLHAAHRQMVALAREMLGCPIAYEISMVNVDKPPLDFIEIDARVSQFAARDALWLTRAPLYAQKAELFPGATFVVGADTLARIGQARYYDGTADMELAIATMASRGCRFLVFGRAIDGSFRTLANLQLPASLAAMCDDVPENRFRDEMSSTQLRRQGGHESPPAPNGVDHDDP
jgi:nicotinamide mononucleotide (NMN) deamidase PncC